MTNALFPTAMPSIASLSVAALAEQFGTPLYVYDAAVIRTRIREMKQAGFEIIRYAQKANSNLSILRLMRSEGVVVDSVSAWEIRRALEVGYMPGVDPPEIVYTADLFDHESLDLVAEHGLPANLGSRDMIDQLGKRAPGSEIILRINPGFGHGHSQKTNTGGEGSKHGIWHEQLADCVHQAAQYDLTITGLHMHIGSGTDFEHLSQVCNAMEQAAMQVGKSVHTISAGGGLPVPYSEEETRIDLAAYYQSWDATRKRLAKTFGHAVALEIEPGRYLMAESGYLISEVRAVKQMGSKRYVLVDAGFNNLARPVMYGAFHPMAISAGPNHPPAAIRPTESVVVGGPLCESGDVFTQQEGGYLVERELPEASVGDFLVIQNAGAYGYCMSNNYNSKPLSAEVLLENGEAKLIRKKQTFEELIAAEQ